MPPETSEKEFTLDREQFTPPGDIDQIFEILYPGRWFLLAFTLVGTLLAAAYFFSLPNQYPASTQILIQGASNYASMTQMSGPAGQNQVAVGREDYDYYQNQLAILASNRIAALVNAEFGQNLKEYDMKASRFRQSTIIG